MIIKKPYAFLIKNFKIIHGILFLALAFITYKNYNIYSFFNSYANNHYFINSIDLSAKYINLILFFILFLSSLISLIIYYILKIKKKDSRIYLFIFISMIIVFIYDIVIFNVLTKLETSSMKLEIVRVYRDISLIITLPQLVFSLIILSRTFGFNLKQFEFNKGNETIEILETDNEEVELTFGSNSYKYKRFFRKLIRLIKYFIIENKLFVICFSSLIVLVVSFIVFLKINVYSKEYAENQIIKSNALSIKINNSYITKYNLQNEVIEQNKKYIIVDMTVKNNYAYDFELLRETFELYIDDNYIIPIFSLKNEFSDLGNYYEPMKIKYNEENNFIIIYEIDNSIKDNNYLLKIKNTSGKSINDLESQYKNIRIKPKNLDNKNNIETYNLPIELDLKDTMLNDMKLSITSYEIADSFKDKYTIVSNNVYKEKNYYVTPNNIGNSNKTILKLKASLNINEDNRLYNIIKNSTNLIDYYGVIKYKSLGNEVRVNANIINTKYNNNEFVYLEVPEDIKNADYIQFLLEIRGTKYTINLK